MKNKLLELMTTSVFLMSLSALGMAEPTRPLPPAPHPSNPATIINAVAGEEHVHEDTNQAQEKETQEKKAQATAQVEQSTQQALQQGVSQTQQTAEQLRQNMNAVAQDMQQSVSSTKVE